MLYLVKFGYDGRNFTGYQRGNGERSVEDTILSAMSKYSIASSFSSAARTDRGVSAAGNVIMFSTAMEPEKALGILNASCKGIVFHSYANVPANFRVRFSSSKQYRYILKEDQINPDLFPNLLKKFEGTHDFTLFSRNDHRSPVRTVDRVEVKNDRGLVISDIYGPNFVWNQIRSMVGFASFYSRAGRDSDPFSITKRSWPVAPPENLILMDISYKEVEFTKKIKDKFLTPWRSRIWDLDLRSSVLSDILQKAQAEGK